MMRADLAGCVGAEGNNHKTTTHPTRRPALIRSVGFSPHSSTLVSKRLTTSGLVYKI